MNLLTVILSIFIFAAIYFQVFILITYLENKKVFVKKTDKKDADYFCLPSTTIIVPCYNEEKTVAKTVRSLLDLDYPKDKLSIFIVDDGSTDKTPEAVSQFISNKNIRYFRKENGGKHTALNLGIENARTELIGCLDADSFVSKKSLLAVAEEFLNHEIMAVTPSIKIYEPSTVIQRVQETEYVIGLILRKLLAAINAQYVTPGPFSIYRRLVFEKIGKFKFAHNTEDMEMAMRMQMHRMKIENAFDAEVSTVAPKTFRILLRQRLRWTYGFLRNAIDYKKIFFSKKYGNAGMFSMPAALISIIAGIYFFFYIGQGLVKFLYAKLTYLNAVGFNPSFDFKFDWFFLNTGVVAILVYFSFAIFFTLLMLSIYHVRGRVVFNKSDLYYVLLYGLIAPIWMLRAVSQLVLWRPVQWK